MWEFPKISPRWRNFETATRQQLPTILTIGALLETYCVTYKLYLYRFLHQRMNEWRIRETAPPEIEVPVEAAPSVVQETAQETSATKKPKFDHQFQEKWRAKWAWLVKNDDGIGMTCDICSKCDKSNSFTTGCTNFRTSTIERHVITHDHQEAVKAQTMQRGFLQASLDNLPNVMYIIEHATDKKKKKINKSY